MEELWEYLHKEGCGSEVLMFSMDLGLELQKQLRKQFSDKIGEGGNDVRMLYDPEHKYNHNKNNRLVWSYTLDWRPHHGGSLEIYRADTKDKFLIVRNAGIHTHMRDSSNVITSSPEVLRVVADMYDFVDRFLRERFGEGKASSSHEGDVRYSTPAASSIPTAQTAFVLVK